MLNETRLAAFITDLQAGGGAALRHLSADFGRHRGLSGADWIAREEGEFAGRNIGPVKITLIGGAEPDGQQRFLVQTEAGKLVYEDRIGSDANGLLRGDQAPVELISKLEFRAGQPPRRALACRAPQSDLRQVIPRDPAVLAIEQAQAAAQAQDGFTRLWVTLAKDDFATRTVNLRFYMEDEASTLPVLLRGIDHPLFEDDNYAQISGPALTLPGDPSRLWRVTILLTDGSTHILEAPKQARHSFAAPIARVIVTDPLDNDWISEAQNP